MGYQSLLRTMCGALGLTMASMMTGVCCVLLALSPAGESETPKFKNDEAAQAFVEGRELFDKGQWKDATKRFRDCRKLADREEKKALKAWLAACKGGTKLEAVSRAIARSDWRGAWGQLEKIRASYGRTPLEEKITALSSEVEQRLFLSLATFEEHPPPAEAASRPPSCKINTDPRYVKEGKRSLEWSKSISVPGRNPPIGFLPLSDFSGKNLEEYRYLHISIYSLDKIVGKYTLFFDTGHRLAETGGMDPTAILRTRCFYHHLTITKPGWNDFRIDLWKNLSTHSNPTRAEIQRLILLMISPSKPKKVFIDAVKLEKK